MSSVRGVRLVGLLGLTLGAWISGACGSGDSGGGGTGGGGAMGGTSGASGAAGSAACSMQTDGTCGGAAPGGACCGVGAGTFDAKNQCIMATQTIACLFESGDGQCPCKFALVCIARDTDAGTELLQTGCDWGTQLPAEYRKCTDSEANAVANATACN